MTLLIGGVFFPFFFLIDPVAPLSTLLHLNSRYYKNFPFGNIKTDIKEFNQGWYPDHIMSPTMKVKRPNIGHKNGTKIASLYAQSLNVLKKHSQILQCMRTIKADIMFLQGTHFKADYIPKLSNPHFPTALHATYRESKTKGVSILFSKNEEGHFLFVEGSIGGKRLNLANLYSPNVKQVPFFRLTLQKLASFQEGTLIVGEI